MFTGIIKHLGTVESLIDNGSAKVLNIKVDEIVEGLQLGDSVAINGVCLSVTSMDSGVLSFDVISESLERTNLRDLSVDDQVNVEFSMRLNDFVGGHLVSGHSDFVSELVEVDDNRYYFSLPSEFHRYLVVKGSIVINGVSLTVTSVSDGRFSVDLIPSTLKETNFSEFKVSSRVNIEIDMIARYLEKLIK